MNDEFENKRKDLKCCCAAKQYQSADACISGNTLKILPRVVIFKKCLKAHNSYESTVNVLNDGLHKRHLDVTTDASDTIVRIYPKELENNFLLPSQSLQICVCITPKTKLRINRRRHIFITSQHPNITFSIPIIIAAKSDDEKNICVPLHIQFPATTVEQFSYYKTIVYNNLDKKLQFSVKCAFPNLTIETKSFNIKRNDYAEILLKLHCKDLKTIENSLRFKFNTGDKFDVTFTHEPLQWSLFADTQSINFQCVGFKRRKTQQILICNDSNKTIVFNMDFVSQEEMKSDFEKILFTSEQKNTENSSNVTTDCEQNVHIDKFSYKHFAFEPKCGTIHANSSFAVKISFCPVMHEDFAPKENEFSPFHIIAGVLISVRDEPNTVAKKISLKGEIIGPIIEILPDILHINDIYFGEEQLVEVTVQNKDDLCDSLVNLCEVPNLENSRIIATPKDGLLLKPNKTGVFQLQFYVTTMGSFLIQLELKVKYGAKYLIILKGYSKPVQVKSFPENINLGIIPIAIPQKRHVLLFNPLTIPITVQCSVANDGNETPLVLNVHNTEENLPITVKDPLNYCHKLSEYHQESYDNFPKVELIQGEEEYTLLSGHSQADDDTSCSTEFVTAALDLIPDMSCQLISHLKTMNILNKPEKEKTVIEEVLNVLLKTPYFCHLDKYKNYTQLDWNSLAIDPQEIYCNTEIIYLKPGTGKAVSIIIVPNVLGYQIKHLALRVCPLVKSTDHEITNMDFNQIVNTKILSSELCIEYTCSVPEIVWENIIVIMKDQVYAGEFYDVQMKFHNKSEIGGFFYYDVIPQSSLGVLNFPNKIWKYFIEAGSTINVACQVKFTKLGLINLVGCIKFVGVPRSFPFRIQAEVLPPRVNILPRNIYKNLAVLETTTFHIFIENATPTTTWFQLKLRDDSRMSFEPNGGQLAPNGQAAYVSLNAGFQDPGIYKNILYIVLEFEVVEQIPITINVKGLPIFFEPEIRGKDINFGCLFCDSEDINCGDKQNYAKFIKVINKGLRSYRLSITRTKNSPKHSCFINPMPAKLTIKPNNLIIPGLSETRLGIYLNSTEAISIYNEFRVQLSEENNIKHMESNRFTVAAKFIIPELSWNRREITMKYYRTSHCEGCEQWETVRLKNNMKTCVENVKLTVSGPFQIKQFLEHIYENELKFAMKGFEIKEFFLALNKDILSSRSKKVYEGNILCSANLRVQKSVRLRVLMYIPKITIPQNQIVLVTSNEEGETHVELINSGQMPANYKWKKLKEELRYISQEDNVGQVASMVLSDILDTIEQETIEPEFESETNMTRRYQKYKCIRRQINDPLNVKEILYELIQNLDLSAKRYKLSSQAPVAIADDLKKTTNYNRFGKQYEIDKVISQDAKSKETVMNFKQIKNLFINPNFQSNSCKTSVAATKYLATKDCVYHILDDILDHLKLEDSCGSFSMPSSETCKVKSSVYFLEKCGQLQEMQKIKCALHIPPIREGFEICALFQLDVAGGESQQLEIVLVNLNKAITVSKQKIYLGLKPWYERYRSTSFIENTTNYQLSLTLQVIPKVLNHELPKIALGFCNILNNKTLHLSPFQSAIIKVEGIMGFTEDFKREINIIANDSKENTLELCGHGLMPMLTVLKPSLPISQQQSAEIHEEYKLLQKIYYFEMFKPFTDQDDDFYCTMPEEEESQSYWTNFHTSSNISDYGSPETVLETNADQRTRILRLVGTYVFVSQTEDLPNYKVLHQLLETEKFLNRLRWSPETSTLLSSLYHNYLLHFKDYDEQLIINLKHFSVQSLPFHLTPHILDMGRVYLNQFRKIIIPLDFYGPGKLIAAASTAVKISGLWVDFQVIENFENIKFIYYRTEVLANSCDKPYRNIYERIRDEEMNPQIRHAHSYDFNAQQQHERIITHKDKKCLKKTYDSLNKSIHLERKHNFTYCKIAGNKKCPNATNVNINILFRPQKAYFEHNQILEDYLFIDLHMGTTLPILLRAVIIDPRRKDIS